MPNKTKSTSIWAIVYRKDSFLYGMYFSRAGARSMLKTLGEKKASGLRIIKATVIISL